MTTVREVVEAIPQLPEADVFAILGRVEDQLIDQLGPRPDIENFKRQSVATTPLWLRIPVYIGILIVLVAAGYVSFTHTQDAYKWVAIKGWEHQAAEQEIMPMSLPSSTASATGAPGVTTVANPARTDVLVQTYGTTAGYLGIAMVALAEIMQILTSLKAALLGGYRKNPGLFVFTVMATMVALIGNMQFMVWGYVGTFVMAVFPPILTMGIAKLLEDDLLEAIRARMDYMERYSQAMERWERLHDDITRHDDYLRLVGKAIFNRMEASYGKRKAWKQMVEMMTADRGIGNVLRRALVMRELNAGDWMTDTDTDLSELMEIRVQPDLTSDIQGDKVVGAITDPASRIRAMLDSLPRGQRTVAEWVLENWPGEVPRTSDIREGANTSQGTASAVRKVLLENQAVLEAYYTD